MTDTDERTRVEAAAIIAGRGHHEAALAVLGTALASDTPPTRMHAREALWKTCETADPTALLQMLDDIDDPGRILAIELLGDSRSQDLRIADGLERMVSQVNGLPTRASLLWALGGLGQIGADRLISLAASYPELQPWADAGLERAADLATGERPPWVTCDGIAVQVDATEDVRNDTPILRLRVRCRNVSPQHVAVPTYVAGSTSTSPPCAVYYRGRKLPPIGIKITFGPISRGPDHIHYQRLRPGEVWEFWRELRLLDRSSPWIAYYDRTFGISIKGDILAEEPDWWTDVPRGERVGISVPLRALRYTTSIPRVLPGVAGSSDARVWMGDFASAPVYLSLPD
ncbi:MAG: HEAT repeat domain-containing protein [Phycisphaerales bacterium]|nr:HEAT repeat domain-containing protein [Phycisphaerales bacterium]